VFWKDILLELVHWLGVGILYAVDQKIGQSFFMIPDKREIRVNLRDTNKKSVD